MSLLKWTTSDLLGFYCNPTSSIAAFTDFITRLSLEADAAKIFRSSMYRRSVTFVSTGLDSLYPSDAFIFQAIGFRQTVKSLEHGASPCGRPFLNHIVSQTSLPFVVVVTNLGLQLLDKFWIALHSHVENLCISMTSFRQPRSMESYAFLKCI